MTADRYRAVDISYLKDKWLVITETVQKSII
jgi:hypothetical protein